MIDRNYVGLIEYGFFASLALGVLAWQWWLVRDAGTTKMSPEDARHPEGEHQPDDR
jgi:hypothetical protein